MKALISLFVEVLVIWGSIEKFCVCSNNSQEVGRRLWLWLVSTTGWIETLGKSQYNKVCFLIVYGKWVGTKVSNAGSASGSRVLFDWQLQLAVVRTNACVGVHVCSGNGQSLLTLPPLPFACKLAYFTTVFLVCNIHVMRSPEWPGIVL